MISEYDILIFYVIEGEIVDYVKQDNFIEYRKY